jgi:hypothetical protein
VIEERVRYLAHFSLYQVNRLHGPIFNPLDDVEEGMGSERVSVSSKHTDREFLDGQSRYAR